MLREVELQESAADDAMLLNRGMRDRRGVPIFHDSSDRGLGAAGGVVGGGAGGGGGDGASANPPPRTNNRTLFGRVLVALSLIHI